MQLSLLDNGLMATRREASLFSSFGRRYTELCDVTAMSTSLSRKEIRPENDSFPLAAVGAI